MKIFAVLILVLTATSGWATPQFPDTLLVDGRRLALTGPAPSMGSPLVVYLFDDPKRWAVVKGKYRGSGPCSAVFRGYLATWEVKDDRLYLTKVTEAKDCLGKDAEIPLEELFPGAEQPIRAEWVSGVLMALERDGYLLFQMRNGRVIARAFKKSEAVEEASRASERARRLWENEEIASKVKLPCPPGTTQRNEPWSKGAYSISCRRNGVKHGPWQAWEDGHISVSGSYDEDKENGRWVVYAPDGKELYTMDHSQKELAKSCIEVRDAQPCGQPDLAQKAAQGRLP